LFVAEFCATVEDMIVQVAPLLRDSDLNIQYAAVDMLGELTSHSRFFLCIHSVSSYHILVMLHSSLKNTTFEVISLLEGDILYILSAAMNGLGILANQCSSHIFLFWLLC
jgi:HEAT repeat protein